MTKIYFLSAQNKLIDLLIKGLKTKSFEPILFSSLFEIRKYTEEEKPDALIMADNLKEKSLESLISSIMETPKLDGIPIIGLVTEDHSIDSVKTFFNNGAVEVIRLTTEIEEIYLRIRLRVQESGLRNVFTPNEYFFSEAQEKEQGKRSGIFHFYSPQKIMVGEIAVKDGKVVHATYGDIIKEDAFLQLACNGVLSFRFEDTDDIEIGKINASITNLLLEAYKLKDEIKKQENVLDEALRSLIIDNDRIERLLANRMLKLIGVNSKVVGVNEFSLRLMAQFTPSFLILDNKAAPKIMDLIWQNGRTSEDIPVIIYCDEEVKDINFSQIGKHQIDYVVHKKNLYLEIKSILSSLFNFSPEN
jgi:DNA-binding NtrC family response regulator